MASIFDLYTLNPSQEIAKSHVLDALKEDLSQTEALAEFRALGGKIRTSSWGTLWHIAEGEPANAQTLALLGENELIPLESHALSQTSLSDNFSYKVSFDGYDKVLRQNARITRTITSDQELSTAEIYSNVPDVIGQSGTAILVDMSSVTLEEALVSFDYHER